MSHNTANWIAQFTAQHGRPPRILHVGNIANNAYQTAKMLNAAGADCDVLCNDYYHTMGTPEWDDADFDGEVGNQSAPAWHKVNLHGFQRPAWFSQGPRKTAIGYLLARRTGQQHKARRLWARMERTRRYLSFREESFLKPVLLFGERLKNRLRDAFYFALARLGFHDKSGWTPAKQNAILAKLQQDAKTLFPQRPMAFGPLTHYYIRTAFLYAPLFHQYDIVQAYALDPVWPYLLEHKNYVAWEHGTLRDAPYEDSEQGYLLLLAYANAAVIYVTNVDCYDSALTIAKPLGTPLICGLHGFDTERMLQKQQLAHPTAFERTTYAKPDEQLFFCPARIDIDPHYGTYLKKNDMLYNALGRLWGERGGGFRILQLEWGHDVAALKDWLHKEWPALEDAVIWHPPFQKTAYYQILQNAALVFDNLLLPLMGGNGIETLMSGHAALVNKRIPEEMMRRFFPEMWPVFAIDSEDDIYAAAKIALADPAACLNMAKAGQQWILRHHGHAAIVERNLQSYQLIYPLPQPAPERGSEWTTPKPTG